MKNTNNFIRLLNFLVTTTLLACFGYSVSMASIQPNIVVILADDMYWHHPGFNGGPVSTPNLDRLASNGTSLTLYPSLLGIALIDNNLGDFLKRVLEYACSNIPDNFSRLDAFGGPDTRSVGGG